MGAMTKRLCHYEGYRYFYDGDSLCVVKNDFVNLQESWSFWPVCPRCGSTNLLTPAKAVSYFTCDDCAYNFSIRHMLEAEQ
jgi:transposase-like protein